MFCDRRRQRHQTSASPNIFAALGAKVGICGRRQEKLNEAAAELRSFGVDVYAQTCDVREYPALKGVIEGCHQELGPIDVLVCAAAGNFPCPAEVLSPNGFKSVVDIDLRGSFHACHAAVEQLKENERLHHFHFRGPGILAVSVAMPRRRGESRCRQPDEKTSRSNGAKHGIRSNSIAPGPIEGTEGARPARALRARPNSSTKQIPLGRHGTVEEVAQAAVFLASPLASYITGTVLVVDGGQNLPGSGAGFNVIQQAWQEQAGNPGA